jgi:hypothetical protein
MMKKALLVLLAAINIGSGQEIKRSEKMSLEARTLTALKNLSDIISIFLVERNVLVKEREDLIKSLEEAIDRKDIPTIESSLERILKNSRNISRCAKELHYFTKFRMEFTVAGLETNVIDLALAEKIFTTSGKIFDLLIREKQPAKLKEEIAKAFEMLKNHINPRKAGQKLARFFYSLKFIDCMIESPWKKHNEPLYFGSIR